MLVRKRAGWQLLLSGIIVTIGILFKSSVLYSSEIQAFGFLGAEGQFNVDYLFEDNFSGKVDLAGNPKDSSTDQKRKVIQENLEVLFHSFLYHPNFVKLDFGFGLVLTQSEVNNFEIDQQGKDVFSEPVKAQNTALDFNFRLSFFEKKDYPFSIFYANKHPAINAVSSDAFISETTRFGLNFLWNAPVKINLDAVHYDVKGESNLRVVNDQVDSSIIRAYKSLKNDGHVQASFTHQVQSSKSGSTLSAIRESINISDGLTYDSRYNFGSDREYVFNLVARYQQNRKSFEFNEVTIAPSLDWKHSENLKSNYRYSYSDNEYSDIRNTAHTVNAGVSYSHPNGFSTRFNGNGIRTELLGATTTLVALQNTSSYRHSFKHAVFSVSAFLGFNQSQSVTNFEGNGIASKESLTMPSKNEYVILAEKNIITAVGSFTVRSAKLASLVYTANKDYVIEKRGKATFAIQTYPGGKLQAGDEVVVEYLIDPGQNNKFQRISRGLNTSLQFFDYFNIYAGINQSNLTVLDGQVSDTVVRNHTVSNTGAGVDYPLFDFILIGAEIRNDNTDEDFITTDARSESAYAQVALFRGASVYLSRRHSVVVYSGINVGNDSDRTDYRALLKIQTSFRTNLSLIYDDSKDIGNINLKKENTTASMRFEWGYRKILVRATALLSKNQRGDVFRERKAFQINFVRTF